MAKNNSQHSVHKLYESVMDATVRNLRQTFLDAGLDDSLRDELLKGWKANLKEMGSVTDYETDEESTNEEGVDELNGNEITLLPQNSALIVPVLIQKIGDSDNSETVAVKVPAAAVKSQANWDAGTICPDLQEMIDTPDNVDAPAKKRGGGGGGRGRGRGKARGRGGGRSRGGGRGRGKSSGRGRGSGRGKWNPPGKKIPQHDGGPDFESSDNDEEDEYEDVLDDMSEIEHDAEDNFIVCQYEKITHKRNQWKFVLRDGIMQLGGKDYVFGRGTGETI